MTTFGKELLIAREKSFLSKYAAKSDSDFLTKRIIPETSKDSENNIEYRLPFQRDRDRIVHSRAFRRLMHKTQIFNANMGDHYRNRLTHTLEVNQIARSIGKVLGLNDELIEAIALGHDLGHTPFGHIGERTLHMIISGKMFNSNELKVNNFGGFKHNFQGLQLIDNIENSNPDQQGMNLTLAVREGILKHTGRRIKVPKKSIETSKFEIIADEVKYQSLDLTNINIDDPSFTLEGQVVAIADEIAQCTHDLEDGIRAGIISIKDISEARLIVKICNKYDINLNDLKEVSHIRNVLIKFMVGYLINNVCISSIDKIKEDYKNEEYPEFKNKTDVYRKQLIVFSAEIETMQEELSKMISKLVVASQKVSQSDSKAEYIIIKLFKAYFLHPQQLPDYVLNRYFSKKGILLNRLTISNMISELQSDPDFIRLICDHIGSMTDQYAAREYIKLFQPEYF